MVCVDRANDFLYRGNEVYHPLADFLLVPCQIVYMRAELVAALHNSCLKATYIHGPSRQLRFHHLLQLSYHAVCLLYVGL